jgi:hypothetical protein
MSDYYLSEVSYYLHVSVFVGNYSYIVDWDYEYMEAAATVDQGDNLYAFVDSYFLLIIIAFPLPSVSFKFHFFSISN